MMAVLELYGKCKELGSCDCEGFFGCHDPKPPAPKPVIENELANAMKAEREVSDYSNHNYRRELEAIEQSEGLVECEVCHRSHLSSHPHITNIEGDVPIDDAEPVQRKSSPVISLPPPDDQLPGWLREKQAGEAGQPGDLDQAEQLCKLCGKPWAPRHDCNPAETTVSKKRVTPYHMRQIAKGDICGKKKQSNHKCKGRPDAEAVRAAGGCEDCERAGELCVRHGGVWSDYDIAKVETRPTDDRVAKTLP